MDKRYLNNILGYNTRSEYYTNSAGEGEYTYLDKYLNEISLTKLVDRVNISDVENSINENFCKKLCPFSGSCKDVKYEFCAKKMILNSL